MSIKNLAELEARGLFDNATAEDDDVLMLSGEEEVLSALQEGPLSIDERFALKSEAYALHLAHAHNKILSLSNSRTRILAHQVESTHRIVSALNQRFLIADEVGLGKTVEAGLVIKELVYRYGCRRILIVCPASLLLQWQQEMAGKFNEHFEIIDRRVLGRKGKKGTGRNPWLGIERAICSLDFIKNEAFSADLKRTRWDAVIFDEAHRLRRDSVRSTLAYNVAEIIAENTRSLLLLTATPFRGKLEELYYLIRLIDRNLLGPFQSFYAEYCMEGADLSALRAKLSTVVIRRTKREVGGFTRRHARTIRFELYPDERLLYDETTRYVAEEFNRAMMAENRAVGFVMTVFQKLLDSSSPALRAALENRRDNLRKKAEEAARAAEAVGADGQCPETDDCDEPEDLGGLAGASLAKTAREMEEEVRTLDFLIGLARNIAANKKGEKLRDFMAMLRERGVRKFVIFTQFRSTQDYLAGLLPDFSVAVFNGSMDRDAKEEAIRRFREEVEVLVCTEAGGEGRNMQFCSVLINYDLPWSPLKIEQRIGRIHRFGQQKDVRIYNFATKDTVAERVLEVLDGKLRLFEESIGTPDVMLGQIEDEVNLNALFMEMAAGRKSVRRVMEEIDDNVERARMSYEKIGELTVTRALDFNYDRYYEVTLKERQFSLRRIERFIGRMRGVDPEVGRLLGERNRSTGLYAVRSMPSPGMKAGRYGSFDSRIALDNEDIEFLAFGHPIVEHLFARCRDDAFGGRTGVRVLQFDSPFRGMIFNYLVSYVSTETVQELVPVAVDQDLSSGDAVLSAIEEESLRQESCAPAGTDHTGACVGAVRMQAPELFRAARERVLQKVGGRLREKMESLDLSVDPEVDKIRENAARRVRELEEQLERQECQRKWFGRDMRGAITRTRNEIERVELEREKALAFYRNHRRVRATARLLSAGVLYTVSPEDVSGAF